MDSIKFDRTAHLDQYDDFDDHQKIREFHGLLQGTLSKFLHGDRFSRTLTLTLTLTLRRGSHLTSLANNRHIYRKFFREMDWTFSPALH